MSTPVLSMETRGEPARPPVTVRCDFNRTWGLWQVTASDCHGSRLYLETPDEGKARAGEKAIREQGATTLDEVRALWDGLGPWDGVEG